jgi:outer membrane protein assembly factor BamD
MARITMLALLALVLHGRSPAGQDMLVSTNDVVIAQRSTDDVSETDADRIMEIGRYYVGRRDYAGALARFKHLLTHFRTSRHVEEALPRLTETYLALGVASEAQTAAAVLDRKFPNSDWSASAREVLRSKGLDPAEDEQSWISRTFK